MYYQIELKPVPAQTVSVVLANQSCVISTRQIGGRQYFSLSKDGKPICENVLMVDRSRIVRAEYTGFKGDFIAVDTSGKGAPFFDGWGSRFFLLYSESDLNDR